jgi:hypothetical protein
MGVGAPETPGNVLLQTEIGLLHGIGSLLIKEPLGTNSFKEGAAGAVGERSPQEGSPWKNFTAIHLRKEGTAIPVRVA